ncbi:MAG: Holliday junction resolvase RuvX [Microgenomates group bacterium]
MDIPPKTLGIDFGTRRIGLALSFATLVEPLEVISYTDLDSAIRRIAEVCAENFVEQVVVGISEGDMAEQTHSFISLLKSKVQLRLFTADETLSSQEVKSKMAGIGKKHSQANSGPIDHYAATVILEEWFATRER